MARTRFSMPLDTGVFALLLAAAFFALLAPCGAQPRAPGRRGVVEDPGAILRLLSTPAVLEEVNRAVKAGYTMTDISYQPSAESQSVFFINVERRRPSGALGTNYIEMKAEVRSTGEIVVGQVSPIRIGE